MRREDEEFKIPKSRFAVLIFTFLITITTVVSIYDLYMLLTIDSFKKYIYVGMGLLVFIWLILVIKTKKRFSKKRRRKPLKSKFLITFQVIYLLLTGVFAGFVTYFYLYLGNFNNDYVTYSSSLVVMSKNDAKKLKDLKNYTIAILDDKNSPEGYIIPKEVIKEKELDDYNTIKKYDNYSTMVADLYSGDVDAIFINTDYVKTYSTIEEYQNIEDETKIIYTKEKKMEKVTKTTKKASSGKKVTEPFTILLLGVDSTTEGLDKNTVALGDSIMLITFNPKTLNATLLSIPRDSYVPIACWSSKAENKITHAAAYGTDCMISTIENYFDVDIDYYAKINFKGLVHLVDALGGIDVEVPADLCTDDSSRYGEVCIKEGYQHLDGEGALVLSRNRKQLTGGDLTRGQNQQIVIKGMIDKIKDIKSATQFLEILNTVSNNIDTNFTQSQILSFYNIAEDLLDNNLAKDSIDLVNIQQLYLQGTGQMIYDESSRLVLWDYIPNKDSRKDIIKAMKTNLGLEDHDVIKSFTFSINETYEKEIIGYGPYKSSFTYTLVPNFVGLSKDAATTLASKYNIKLSFAGGNGYVLSQDVPAGKRVDKLSGSVKLTLGGEEKETTKKKSCVIEKGKYYDKDGKEVEKEDYEKSCKKDTSDDDDEKDDDTTDKDKENLDPLLPNNDNNNNDDND